jgi:L-2-hydroxyglutarate oxidase LhgO
VSSAGEDRYDVVIAGAGIVGLATARQLMRERPGLRLAILDKERAIAAHQSGRNSGVLHSGIYYAPGSLKAETAIAGRAAMLEYCSERGIPTRICGKVIVASREDQRERLLRLHAQAQANGVRVELIGSERLAEIEPHATGVAALFVPDAGIVDYRAVCRALRTEATSPPSSSSTAPDSTPTGWPPSTPSRRTALTSSRFAASTGLYDRRAATSSAG